MGEYRGIMQNELWVMGYELIFPVNSVGQHQNLWVTAEYGLIQLWIISELTVYSIASTCISILEYLWTSECHKYLRLQQVLYNYDQVFSNA